MKDARRPGDDGVMRFRWIADRDLSPANALATGAALYRGLSAMDAPPLFLYGASLSGDAIVLGQHQRALDALDVAEAASRGTEVLRRATGGPACVAGKGIHYVALGLRHASVLMECPSDRVLNRNVRGLLGGLALAGARANYFGRDYIAVDKRPAGLLGWTRDGEGGVLLECFLAVDRPFTLPEAIDGYPMREEMTEAARTPFVMREVWDEAPAIEDLIRMLAEGHLDRYPDAELELDRSSPSDAERGAADELLPSLSVGFDDAWDTHAWSRVREVPIGFVSAGVTMDDEGFIADAVVAGDFYQDEEVVTLLAKKLAGTAPDPDAIAEVLRGVWDGQNRVLEGLKDLTVLTDALVEAAKG